MRGRPRSPLTPEVQVAGPGLIQAPDLHAAASDLHAAAPQQHQRHQPKAVRFQPTWMR